MPILESFTKYKLIKVEIETNTILTEQSLDLVLNHKSKPQSKTKPNNQSQKPLLILLSKKLSHYLNTHLTLLEYLSTSRKQLGL
ncbi:MAG: hypothetical protein EBY22_11555 [Gammaproteobacteria bacterium]|nr:hypothetical protein [Gammaproteobacteria bacterium]